jgi:hypothetical protein
VTYEGVGTLSHDTSFINFVIYDSLKFELQPDGMYQFRDDDFFPLDGRGFGEEWNYHCQDSSEVGDHNYAFTMELNWKFVMREGLVFILMAMMMSGFLLTINLLWIWVVFTKLPRIQ